MIDKPLGAKQIQARRGRGGSGKPTPAKLAPEQRGDELVELALAEFGELLPGEEKMLRAVAKGDMAILAAKADDDLEAYRQDQAARVWESWVDRRIRANVLRWLCVFERAQALVDAMGINVEGAWIDGQLRLDGARIPFRIALVACACPAVISLRDAHLDLLLMSGSVLGEEGILADRMKITGSVYFRNGFVSHGAVCLLGASIGRDLSCTRGTFNNEGGNAISADGIKVTGSVYLRDGFVSHGVVRLLGASIGGNLECTRGSFDNEGGLALYLQGAKIEGALLLRDEVFWSGEIDLTSAQTDYLLDEPGAYPDRLRLTDFRYRAIFNKDIGSRDDRLAWLEKSDTTCQDHGRFDPQPYRHLASMLRRQGHDWFANEVMYTASKKLAGAQQRRLSESGSRWTLLIMRVWHVMLDGLVGHGYRRWLPIPWLLGFVLFGALVFSDFDPQDMWHAADADPGAMQPTQGLVLKDAMKSERWIVDYPAFRPLAYSADTFLPLVNLHQESYWTPKDGIIKRLYLPLHIIAGWIVTTMAALSFTGLVRHERE